MKTETCKLCFRDFWIFLPNIIKIDHYNSELYRLVHFLRHSVVYKWDTLDGLPVLFRLNAWQSMMEIVSIVHLLTGTRSSSEAEWNQQVRMNSIHQFISNPALWNELFWIFEVFRQSQQQIVVQRQTSLFTADIIQPLKICLFVLIKLGRLTKAGAINCLYAAFLTWYVPVCLSFFILVFSIDWCVCACVFYLCPFHVMSVFCYGLSAWNKRDVCM